MQHLHSDDLNDHNIKLLDYKKTWFFYSRKNVQSDSCILMKQLVTKRDTMDHALCTVQVILTYSIRP